MKLTGKHLLIALMTLVLGAVPALALAQSPFRASDNAADDQYGTTTTTTPSTTTTTPSGGTVSVTVSTPVGTVSGVVTVSSNPSKTTTTTTPGKGNGGGNGNGNGGGNGNGNGNGRPDRGGNAPESASGVNGVAGNAGTSAAGTRNSAASCTWQPYAWIAFGPADMDVFGPAANVTGEPMYLAQIGIPLKDDVIKAATAGTRFAGAETDAGKLQAFARALGKSVVNGGSLARTALPRLASGVAAEDIHPAAGFVVSAARLQGSEAAKDPFIRAFLAGMRSVKIPTTERGQKVRVPVAAVDVGQFDDATQSLLRRTKVADVANIDKNAGLSELSSVLAAKDEGTAAPLLCRPTASYQPGDLIRRSESGLPGGGRSTGILMLLGLLTAGGVLAVVERRTRRMRRGDTR